MPSSYMAFLFKILNIYTCRGGVILVITRWERKGAGTTVLLLPFFQHVEVADYIRRYFSTITSAMCRLRKRQNVLSCAHDYGRYFTKLGRSWTYACHGGVSKRVLFISPLRDRTRGLGFLPSSLDYYLNFRSVLLFLGWQGNIHTNPETKSDMRHNAGDVIFLFLCLAHEPGVKTGYRPL